MREKGISFHFNQFLDLMFRIDGCRFMSFQERRGNSGSGQNFCCIADVNAGLKGQSSHTLSGYGFYSTGKLTEWLKQTCQLPLEEAYS